MAVTDPPTIAKLKAEWSNSASNLYAYRNGGGIVGGSDTGISGISGSAPALRSFIGAAHVVMTASASPTSVTGSGDGGSTQQVYSDSTTVTPSGGTSPYTYAWSYVSGTTMTVTSGTSATTTFHKSLIVGASISAIYRCTVTDNASHTATADVSIDLDNL